MTSCTSSIICENIDDLYIYMYMSFKYKAVIDKTAIIKFVYTNYNKYCCIVKCKLNNLIKIHVQLSVNI